MAGCEDGVERFAKFPVVGAWRFSATFVENPRGGRELTSGCEETRSEYKTREAPECTVRGNIPIKNS